MSETNIIDAQIYMGCLIMLSLLPRPGYKARSCFHYNSIPANSSKTALIEKHSGKIKKNTWYPLLMHVHVAMWIYSSCTLSHFPLAHTHTW